MASITAADEAVTWAQHSLTDKNTLMSVDDEIIEQAFRKKMSSLMSSLEVLDGTAVLTRAAPDKPSKLVDKVIRTLPTRRLDCRARMGPPRMPLSKSQYWILSHCHLF